jgi:Ca2+/H+ antiporter, TMEM165/GDT1 family
MVGFSGESKVTVSEQQISEQQISEQPAFDLEIEVAPIEDLPISGVALQPTPEEGALNDAIADANPDCVSGKEPGCPPWRVFTTTFVTIFLAELGDKTQVSTLLMSAQFHKPWLIFLGAGSALITTTLLGVLVGRWLSTRLSPRTLDIAAGITLALIAAGLLWDVLQ